MNSTQIKFIIGSTLGMAAITLVPFSSPAEDAATPAMQENTSKMQQPPQKRGEGQMFNDLTPEERQQLEDFKNRTKDMTPEQRKEEASKIPLIKDHMQKREGGAQNGPPAHIKEWMEHLTPEQKQMLQEFRKKIKDLSPEERKEAMQKFRAEHPELKPPEAPKQKNQGVENNKTDNSSGENQRGQDMRDQMDKLSPEQRKQVQEFRSKLKDMSPDERKEALQKFRSEHPDFKMPERHGQGGGPHKQDGGGDMKAPGKDSADNVRQELRQQIEKLTPEEKKQLHEFRTRAKDMTPEERRTEAAKLPLFNNLTPQQRAMLENRFKQLQQMPPERKEKLMKNFDKWKNMSPEQKEEFRKKLRDRKRGEPDQTESQPTVNT